MIERDFHGWPIFEARAEFHQVVWLIRGRRDSQMARFIVGNGAIKEAIMDLAEDLQLRCNEEIGNPGALMVDIE